MKWYEISLGIGLLIVAIVLAVSLGSSGLTWNDLMASLIFRLRGDAIPTPDIQNAEVILWSIRLPRVLMAGLSGAGLSLVGASVQALVRNPMADPWLLGVSSGAALGAVLVLIAGIRLFGPVSLPITAFLGAMSASFMIYRLARRQASLSSSRLIFMGLAISFSLEACTQLVILSANHASQVQNVLFWTMGSLGAVENQDLVLPSVAVLTTYVYLHRRRQELNIAVLPEAKAFSLGLNLDAFRIRIFLVCAGLTSILVSVTGAIGFVGLMVPHLLRQLVGHDYRRLIPACVLGGSLFMIMADLVARNVFEPKEIPIGVLTALLGSPLFIWLMRKSDV